MSVWQKLSPPWVRHLALLLAPVVLGIVGSTVVPALQGREGVAALIGAALSWTVLIVTPLTRQYGVGASKAETAAFREALSAACDLIEADPEPWGGQTALNVAQDIRETLSHMQD